MNPRRQPTGRPTHLPRPSLAGLTLAVLAGMGWLWSLSILWFRVHQVLGYEVSAEFTPERGLLLSALAVPWWLLAGGALAAAGVGWRVARLVGAGPGELAPDRAPAGWRLPDGPFAALCCVGLLAVPALEAARCAWPALPRTFFEPLLLALTTGALLGRPVPARTDAKGKPRLRIPAAAWFGLVVLAAAALAAWWFVQSQRAYDAYMLGYFDFGQFARRVVNTWEGRGFLREFPGTPAFWDHFNPALALLAPLWGLWRDVRLFFAVQAGCLALPALFVFGLARRFGARPPASAMWAGAFLAYPTVGQINLNFSYGWHPESAAIPALFAAAWALAGGRRVLGLLLAVLACGFKEDVFVAVAGLSAGLALLAWLERRGPDEQGASDAAPTPNPIASRLPWWGWLIAAAGFLAALAVASQLADFSRYQVGRFGNLGNTPAEVVLSPVLHPVAFWGEAFRWQSLHYLLAVFVPLGLGALWRGWPVGLALVLPMIVLLGWSATGARSIAFQYNSTLVPIVFLTALTGATRRRRTPGAPAPAEVMRWASARALAASATLAAFIGALPCSQTTTPFVVLPEDRPRHEAHVAVLNEAVAAADDPRAAVLASGRLAAHLLNVGRLETVSDLTGRRAAAGASPEGERQWLSTFDFVVLDRRDNFFQQGADSMERLIRLAEQAGFRRVRDEDGVVVFRRIAEGEKRETASPGGRTTGR